MSRILKRLAEKHPVMSSNLKSLLASPFILFSAIVSGSLRLITFLLENLCVSAFVVAGSYMILAAAVPLLREVWLNGHSYPMDSSIVTSALIQAYAGAVLLRIGRKLPWL